MGAIGAFWLAGFTLIATFVANRFWEIPQPDQFMVENAFSNTWAWLVVSCWSLGTICANAIPQWQENNMLGRARAVDAIASRKDDRDGPLPPLLLVLTLVTGLVDAVSYLKLGQVFVANMTGNVVFLGFAVAGAQNFSVPASLVAIAAFMGGALAGGWLGSSTGVHRGRFLALAMLVQIVLVGAALVVATAALDLDREPVRYALIVLLALAMGLQNATARRLGVPDLTTTVLTLTLAGLAADSTLAGGSSPRPGRRTIATVIMFLGAAVGAFLVFHVGVSAALALALALLILNGIAAYRVSSSSAAWTVGG